MVGLQHDQDVENGTDVPIHGTDFSADAEASPHRYWRGLIVGTICAVAALAWIAFLAVLYAPIWLTASPNPDAIVQIVAAASAPLAIIGIAYILLMRGGKSVVRRHAYMAAGLRDENARLEAIIGALSDKLAHERIGIARQSEELMTLGEDAALRMRGIGDALRVEIETIGRHAHALQHSASTARDDVSLLLVDLPKAHEQTREMVVALDAAGNAALGHADTLGTQLATLAAHGRSADDVAGGAAKRLAQELASIDAASESAGAQLVSAAARMTDAVDRALERAAAASEAARQGMDARGAAMLAFVDQSEAALARTGANAAEALSARVDDVSTRLKALGTLLATQSDTTAHWLAGVRDGLAATDAQFERLDAEGITRTKRLTAALGNLGGHAGDLTTALERGAGTADALIGRTETLLLALDATVREIDETLPAALLRLDTTAETSRSVVAATSTIVGQIDRDASSALDRLIEAEAMLAKQRTALDGLATDTASRLSAAENAAASLVRTAEDADRKTRALAEGAGSQLLDALVRVRDAAQAAAERAREAIVEVIPQSVERLAVASRDALSGAITEQVDAQIAQLGATAETALGTARAASERLMRQMLTVAEASATVEARIVETRAEAETGDREQFAHRVAMLIESLNSTAIDVAKILSNEVTDSAWASYLRGDRGVFTRRAVRLLNAGEVREIARHYNDAPEFKDQVNRYVHDFEALLRNVLATRNGSPLGVTLLSSDMGKLYVALAQAIERLR